MKRVSAERRLWFIRVTKKRMKRLKSSNFRQKAIKRSKDGLGLFLQDPSLPFRLDGPYMLGFQNTDTRDDIITWIAKFRKITLRHNRPVYIDYSKSYGAESMGFLLMLAEIDRVQNIKGTNHVTGCIPKDDVAAQVFHQVGLAKLLGIKKSHKITSEEVIYWRHVYGTQIEGDYAGKLILDLVSRYGFSEEITASLYTGVSEAITNSCMHGYNAFTSIRKKTSDKKWWMFAGVKDQELIVVVCDLGMGIPASLKEKHPQVFEKFKRLFFSGRDSKLIKVAIEEGRSQTEQPNRGLGMAEMKKFIQNVSKGDLMIMSNRGVYSYHGESGRENDRDFTKSIGGTMVGWKVPLDSLKEIESQNYENQEN